MQEGMFYHTTAEPQSHAYFQQLSIGFQGAIQPEIIEQAFQILLDRHEVLRSVFIHKTTEAPVQVVLKQRKIPFAYHDLSGSDKPEQQLRQLEREDMNQGFDLAKDVLTRVGLVKLSSERYQLIWSHHHILMDGWCMNILFAEISQIYDALRQGKTPELRPVRPYQDYIRWIQDQDHDLSLMFWKNYLEGFSNWTHLTGDLEIQQPQADYVSGQQQLSLDEETTSKLRKIAADQGVTFSNLAQAFWGLVLASNLNTNDVVFGLVVSGRPPALPGIEKMIGLFINTLPCRIRIRPRDTFNSLLKTVHRKAAEVEEFQYTRLAEVQQQSQLKHHLIDHLLVIANFPIEEQVTQEEQANAQALQVVGASGHEQTNYQFNILVGLGKQFSLSFKYNRNHYGPAFFEGLGAQMKALADNIVADPDQPIGQLLEAVQSKKAPPFDTEEVSDTYRKLITNSLMGADANARFDWTTRKGVPGLEISSQRAGIDWEGLMLRDFPQTILPSSVSVNGQALVGWGADDSQEQNTIVGAATETEQKIADIWAQVLGHQEVSVTENFFRMAGDSIKATQIIGKMRKAGFALTLKDFMNHATVRSIALMVEQNDKADEAVNKPSRTEFPLSPIQAYFFGRNLKNPAHYNQSVMFELAKPMDSELLQDALSTLIQQHDALRIGFKKTDDRWKQYVIEAQSTYYSFTDLSQEANATEKLTEKAQALQRAMKLELPPLMRVGHFRMPDGSERVLIILHHLIVDTLSWMTLLEQLSELVSGKGKEALLSSDSFDWWMQCLEKHAASKAVQATLPYWQTADELARQSIDNWVEERTRLSEDVRTVEAELDIATTDLLLEAPLETYQMQFWEVLISALAISLHQKQGLSSVAIWTEGHGREDILGQPQVDNTIGWFTTIYPVVFGADTFNQHLENTLIQTKENIRKVPEKGIGYGLLRYMSGQSFKARPQILFNYMGRQGDGDNKSAWKMAKESMGNMQDPATHHDTVLNINTVIRQGSLKLSLQYNQYDFDQGTMNELMGHWTNTLQEIADVCRQQHPQLTPSDMDYKDMSVDELQSFFD